MMLSKFPRVAARYPPVVFSGYRKVFQPTEIVARPFRLIPPSQYDMPWPQRFKFMYLVRVHWEITPLLFVVIASLTMVIYSIFWTVQNKVDVVFLRQRSQNISRSMDLRNPTAHKLLTINQRYEPWPEMQDVLDKMKDAEWKASLETCNAS